MLSEEIRATPRPQPPAKVRARKSSQPPTKGSPRGKASSGSPPPPYYSTSDSVLRSPLPVTSQLLEASNGGNGRDGPGPQSWLLEKSREELSGLLTKAEGIIKSSEERTSLMPPLCVIALSFHVWNVSPSATPILYSNDRWPLTPVDVVCRFRSHLAIGQKSTRGQPGIEDQIRVARTTHPRCFTHRFSPWQPTKQLCVLPSKLRWKRRPRLSPTPLPYHLLFYALHRKHECEPTKGQ